MGHRDNRILYLLVLAIIVLSVITASVGIFYHTDGEPYEVTTQFGEVVMISGNGLYAHDSYFAAPIFRGTDFAMLVVAVPLLIVALVLDSRRHSAKRRIFLLSVIAVFTYYATSIAFGVVYNFLHLLYIALFSASFFGLILAIVSVNPGEVEQSVKSSLPYRGVYVFLILTGISLVVVWLPDILSALLADRPLTTLEVYTTSITNVLDMGIIAPVAFICLYKLVKRKSIGYVLLALLLSLCMVIGVMLPIQTMFQLSAGIVLTVPELITKVAIFSLLAIFALYFNFRLFKAIAE